jgi:hypothetical protein
VTRSVSGLTNLDEIIAAVRSFNEFPPGDDLFGEHDFGAFEVNRERFYFKFDYCDGRFQYFEEDGERVLTIMKAEDY